MADSEDKNSKVTFDGDPKKWTDFKYHIRALMLEHEGLLAYLDTANAARDDDKERLLASIIRKRLRGKAITRTLRVDESNGKELYAALLVFESGGLAKQQAADAVKVLVADMTGKAPDEMSLEKLNALHKLKKLENISLDDIAASCILASLPESYNSIGQIWESDELSTLDDLVAAVSRQAQREKGNDAADNDRKAVVLLQDTKTMTCYACGKVGHGWRRCRDKAAKAKYSKGKGKGKGKSTQATSMLTEVL